MSDRAVIGILGGSGLYEMEDLEIIEEKLIDTPYGEPSDKYIIGMIEGIQVIFLSRHGQGHKYSATGVNYRANIFGFKKLGAEIIVSVNAVGSLREEYHPTDIVIPAQFIDLTKKRENSFFPKIPAVHVDVADPFCKIISNILYEAGKSLGISVFIGGTYICIEGPSFSTRAESNLYRSWDTDVIGMTAATEAKLSREAEICYSSLSLVTDYDVWKETAEEVTAEMILANIQKGVGTAKRIIRKAVPKIAQITDCACRHALSFAIATHPAVIPDDVKEQIKPIFQKYLLEESQ